MSKKEEIVNKLEEKQKKANETLKKGNKTLNEFKEFISKGNVIDLAVGVIIGSAFGKIVTSLVEDILMPLIGIFVGGVDFTGLTLEVGTATVKYGMFIQNVIDFLIVAACIFFVIKLISKLNRKKEIKEAKTPSEEIVLLTEIRDLLKK